MDFGTPSQEASRGGFGEGSGWMWGGFWEGQGLRDPEYANPIGGNFWGFLWGNNGAPEPKALIFHMFFNGWSQKR